MTATSTEGWTDLGHGCAFKFYGGTPTAPGGIWLRFPSSAGDWPYHVGRVPFFGELAWTVEQLEPLTLSPSIRGANFADEVHGYIRAGRWEPC